MSKKICSKCKIEKDTSEFSKNKSKTDGFQHSCKECNKIYKQKYRSENKDKIKIMNKEYYQENKDHIQKQHKEYYENSEEKRKQYYNLNKERISKRCKNNYDINKEYILKQKQEYYKQNIERINEYLNNNKEKIKERRKIYDQNNKHISFSRNSLHRLTNNWKGSKIEYEEILGYKLEDLKLHLSKFGDLGDKNLHIDHIIPISFFSKYISDYKIVAKLSNDLRNLMLLNKTDNKRKLNKLTIEFIPDFHLQSFLDYVLELEEYIELNSVESKLLAA